jgi:glucose-6-phosphate 1-dehydrogenase
MYDSLGVTYDVVQNHIVQMIALALRSVDQTSALEEKRQREQVIASLQVRNDFPKIRAQYEGYREHKGVSPQSETETYVEITCSSVLPLFEGVPIHIIAGKAQPTSSTSIEVHFKDGTHVSFNTEYEEKLTAYKKVLHDALTGDDRIFSSDKEVEYGWVFAHQVKEALRTVPLRVYNPD